MTAASSPSSLPPFGNFRLPAVDGGLLAVSAALLCLGIVMVTSASLVIGDRTGSPFHFLIRHLISVGLGLSLAVLVFRVPLAWWEQRGTLLFFLGVFLLALVMVPGLGRGAKGAVRWIPVGPFNLQSSELMKFCAIVYVAGYLVRRQREISRSFWGFVKPMFLLVIACTFIMAEPDFGTTVVILATAMAMLFLGGVPVWQFGMLLIGSLIALVGLVTSQSYRLQRIAVFLDPWADPFNKGFQLTQALIAFGRGEWLGVGLGNGIQKQFYLPEAHTDFLLAVIAEELGLAGTLAVVGLFAFLVWTCFRIATVSHDRGQRFGGFAAAGIGLLMGFQSFINMGVNTGLLPTKGLTLPFMSFGGNSILLNCMMVGLLARIDYENRRALSFEMPPSPPAPLPEGEGGEKGGEKSPSPPGRGVGVREDLPGSGDPSP